MQLSKLRFVNQKFPCWKPTGFSNGFIFLMAFSRKPRQNKGRDPSGPSHWASETAGRSFRRWKWWWKCECNLEGAWIILASGIQKIYMVFTHVYAPMELGLGPIATGQKNVPNEGMAPRLLHLCSFITSWISSWLLAENDAWGCLKKLNKRPTCTLPWTQCIPPHHSQVFFSRRGETLSNFMIQKSFFLKVSALGPSIWSRLTLGL